MATEIKRLAPHVTFDEESGDHVLPLRRAATKLMVLTASRSTAEELRAAITDLEENPEPVWMDLCDKYNFDPKTCRFK